MRVVFEKGGMPRLSQLRVYKDLWFIYGLNELLHPYGR